MAAKVVNQGLIRCGKQTFESTNYNAARNVQTMSVDDSAVAIAAGDTAANSGGAITNFFDKVFDATPTESAQTITCVMTLASGEGNFTVRRILLHDDTAANVTSSSSSLFGGIDGQSLTKTLDFTMEITITVAFTDNS